MKGLKTLLPVLIVALFFAGCTGGKKMKQDVNLLKTQVSGLTAEVSRLSESSMGGSGAMMTTGGEDYSEGMASGSATYRTPSGFELDAKSIQRALKNAGYYNGTIDGKIGRGSTAALRSFQEDHGLTADGVCGRQTWNKLKVYADTAVK